MRVLVYPHDLELGGSQLNAIELAASVRDLGHDVLVFGRPGALNQRIDDLGLEFVEAPVGRRRPSPRVVRALRGAVVQRGIDVLHGYEWPPALECRLAQTVGPAVSTATVMSMAVAPFLPRDVPLVVGTRQIANFERQRGRQRVTVIEPPVDVTDNAPGRVTEADAFRRSWGLLPDHTTVVCVSRLARELKLEGLRTAVDVVAELSRTLPVQLVLVGNGPARDELEARAAAANARSGRRVVVLTGELTDPRSAYEAADITLGMGGSALRALAFAKPLVVQGERGFWRILSDQTLPQFLWTGWYGVGEEPGQGAHELREALTTLCRDPALRRELGGYGRSLVTERFSLESAAERQVSVYEEARAVRTCLRGAASSTVRAATGYGRYVVRRRASRLLRRGPSDDFNAVPVAATSRNGPPALDEVVR